jgi:hypothetical protein
MAMGIWMDLLVAPRQTRLLARDQFGELLHDLLSHEIVKMPCAMLSGDHLNVTASLSIANEKRYFGEDFIVDCSYS